MLTVGVRELRNHLSDYLQRVREGERVVVTDRGEPVVELSPTSSRPAAERAQGLVRQGSARWHGGKPQGLTLRPRPTKGTVSGAVLEDRR